MTHFTEDEIPKTGRKRTVPNGFYKAVQERFPDGSVSKALISMVKSGRRRNDPVLMAIIQVDHYWKQTERARLLKLL